MQAVALQVVQPGMLTAQSSHTPGGSMIIPAMHVRQYVEFVQVGQFEGQAAAMQLPFVVRVFPGMHIVHFLVVPI